MWADPVLKEKAPPAQAYPRFSSRALGQILRLGGVLGRKAEDHPARARSIVVVTNANDGSVNNEETPHLVAAWRRHGVQVITSEFSGTLRLQHDLSDPAQPGAQTEAVYPVLVKLIDGRQLRESGPGKVAAAGQVGAGGSADGRAGDSSRSMDSR